MQEQNFEQQVSSKMDELSLVPSATVWENVREEIRKKKDRRRILLWMLPLCLLSIGIIWWLINEKASTISSEKTITENQNINRNSAPDTTTNIKAMDGELRVIKKNSSLALKNHRTVSYPTAAKKEIKADEKEFRLFTKEPLTSRQNSNIITADTTTSPQSLKNIVSKTAHPIKKDSVDDTENEKVIINKEPYVKMKETEYAIINDIPGEQIEVKKLISQKSERLQFGINVMVGFSGITTGLFDGFGQKSAQDFSGANPNQSNPGTVITSPPSNIKRGLSYAIGFSIQKKLNPRSTISSGMQYQYYSTGIAVGTMRQRDSILSNVSRDAASYYRNDISSKNYSNQFHFVTLPVSYKYQLFKKFPLQIGAGLSISQLVSTNALHYNSAADIYYQDNSLFHKTQLGFISNLTFKLLRKNKISLDVGPQLNYGITPLQKNSGSQKQHLFSIGINTNVHF